MPGSTHYIGLKNLESKQELTRLNLELRVGAVEESSKTKKHMKDSKMGEK